MFKENDYSRQEDFILTLNKKDYYSSLLKLYIYILILSIHIRVIYLSVCLSILICVYGQLLLRKVIRND
jgi:hypothetical protein